MFTWHKAVPDVSSGRDDIRQIHGWLIDTVGHKCAEIAWYLLTMLPAATMPCSAVGISLYQRKARFRTTGW